MKTGYCIGCLLSLLLALTSSVSAGHKGHFGTAHELSKVNYDSLYELATPLDQSKNGQGIIDRCLAAHGGIDHLTDLKTIAFHYRMISSSANDTSKFDKWIAPERRLKSQRMGSSHQKERFLDHQRAWRSVAAKSEILDGPQYNATLFSYLTLSLPLAMETEPFSEIRVGGREGDSLDYIYLKKNDSLMIVLSIDANSSLIQSSTGIINHEPKSDIYINLFEDYHEVGGYLFPHSVTYISLGLEIGRSEIETVEINPPLAETMFRPRGSIESSH